MTSKVTLNNPTDEFYNYGHNIQGIDYPNNPNLKSTNNVAFYDTQGQISSNKQNITYVPTKNKIVTLCPHGHRIKEPIESESSQGDPNEKKITIPKGPLRIFIPILENEIVPGGRFEFPAERERKPDEEEIIYEKPPPPKPFTVVPENIDFLTLEGVVPQPDPPVFEEETKEPFTIERNPKQKEPYKDQEIVNNEGVLCERLPVNWNETNEKTLSTRMNIKRPIRIPWNETNEGVKTTKMVVPAPYKPTWNEINEPKPDEGYEYQAPEKPDLEPEKFDMDFPGQTKIFKNVESDDETDFSLKGKPKIFEEETGEEVEFIGKPRRNWNRDCEPKNNQSMIYRGKPKPDFEEIKTDNFPFPAQPYNLSWNKVNEEEAPLSMLLPAKEKIFETDYGEPFEYFGKKGNWNDIIKKQNAHPLCIPGEFIPQDFDMIKEQDFFLPENDDIIINDDYNTCDNNIVRPVKAVISKVDEVSEQEEDFNVDVLEAVTREELRKYNIDDGEVLRSQRPKKKNVKKQIPQPEPQVTQFKNPRRNRPKKSSNQYQLRDDNYDGYDVLRDLNLNI